MGDGRRIIGAAVDLGSTTIAVSCMDSEGEEAAAFSFANPQYRYGADVLTRIRYCTEHSDGLSMLSNLVWEELIFRLKEQLGKRCEELSYIVLSGNTVMQHIVRGLPVDGLGRAPFSPVDLEYREEEMNIDWAAGKASPQKSPMKVRQKSRCICVYPPGFSAFVGADIMSGAKHLQMGKSDGYELLVDLGTNGEMLLLGRERGFAASTACGPVFDHVLSGAAYGSESIHAIAGCVKRGLIDKTGQLAKPFFEKGIEIDKGFVIRQENIRNFQLAKGAVYAGIMCLLKRAGITGDDVLNVYISGGLGFYLNIRDAFNVRMLPESFQRKVVSAGNSSLEGAKELLLALCSTKEKNLSMNAPKEEILHEYEKIRSRTECYELAGIPEFQELFIQALEF